MTTTLSASSWASAVANVAYLVSSLPPGSQALLRRGVPGSPDVVLLGTLLEQGAHRHLGAVESDDRVQRWALLIQGIAWCPLTSVSERDGFGTVLGREGYDPAHLRLLLASDPGTPEFAIRFLHACRYLGAKHRAVNWLSAASLVFAVHQEALERIRIRIARDVAANRDSH